MDTQQTSFFVIPTSHLDELRHLEADEPDPDECGGDHLIESLVHTNRLYRHAEEVALHTITRNFPRSESSVFPVTLCLRSKAGAADKPWVLGPEDCLAWARAIDELLEERGGVEWLFDEVARRDEITPEPHWHTEYRDLRAALDRATSDRAGLLFIWYNEGAEQKLADARAEREHRAREPKPTVEYSEDRMAELQAELDELQSRSYEKHVLNREPETDPYVTVNRMGNGLALYTLPADLMDRLLAMWRDYDRLIGDDDIALWDRAGEVLASMNYLAWDEAWSYWHIRQRGHETAWRALERALWASGPTPLSPRNFMYAAAEVPALDEAVQAWLAAQGGRDASISCIAAHTIGESRTHAADAIDHLQRLLAEARHQGHGLVRVPFGP